MKTYDIAIIGAGPAGANAAEYATLNGLSVLLFEASSQHGGVCLNEGCIPSKTFLHTAHLYHRLRDASAHALNIKGLSASMPHLQKRKQQFVKDFGSGIAEGFREMGVEMIEDRAKIIEKRKDGIFLLATQKSQKTYQARHLMLATGSQNAVPALPGLDSCKYIGSREALMLKDLPKSIGILGGGTIAVEMASFFQCMGVEVFQIQRSARILKDMDAELSQAVAESLRETGVQLFTDTQIQEIKGQRIRFSHAGKTEEICPESILIAMGREPATADLGLEELGVKMEGKAVKTNDRLETNIEGLYACGDVNGKSLLAHTARREGQVVINQLLGVSDKMNYAAIPHIVYSEPEACSVGLTEEEAKKQGIAYELFRAPMAYAGRHQIEFASTEGFCKLLCSTEERRVLGGHLLGTLASEYFMPIAMAVDLGLSIDRLSRMAFPHPTVSELIHHAIYPFKRS